MQSKQMALMECSSCMFMTGKGLFIQMYFSEQMFDLCILVVKKVDLYNLCSFDHF